MESTQENKTSEMSRNVQEVEGEKQEKEEQDRTIRHKKTFLEYYKKLMCHISAAAQATGITHRTVNRWRLDDPEFAREMREVREMLPEMWEEKLTEMGMKGDGAMVRFWLGRRHPDYKLKIQHEAVVLNLYGSLDEQQQLDRLRAILAARGSRAGKRKLDLLNGADFKVPENGNNPQQSGKQAEGVGIEPGQKGDLPITEKSLENNGNNDQLPVTETAKGPEFEGTDNQ